MFRISTNSFYQFPGFDSQISKKPTAQHNILYCKNYGKMYTCCWEILIIHNIQMAGSEFGGDGMKAWIHPAYQWFRLLLVVVV